MDGPPRRSPLDRLALVLLVLIGIYVIFAPGFLGWDYIGSDPAFERKVLRVLVGFLFLFVASGVMEKHRLRRRVHEVYEALNMLLYGRNYKRDRAAIGILIQSLDSESEEIRKKSWENLKRLTGHDFALDAGVWRSWWAVNEKRFALRSKRPEE